MHESFTDSADIPAIGDLAPSIALPRGLAWSRLSELRGAPVVLAFYAPNWDPARADEIAGYRQRSAHNANADDSTPPILIQNDTEAAAQFGVRNSAAVF